MSSGLVAVQAPSLIWPILLYLTYNQISQFEVSVRAQTLVKLDQMTRNDPKGVKFSSSNKMCGMGIFFWRNEFCVSIGHLKVNENCVEWVKSGI